MVDLSISYGPNQINKYRETAKELVKSDKPELQEKINKAFFDGNPLGQKNFSQIVSVTKPVIEKKVHPVVSSQLSFSAVMGFIEGIPFLGTPIAIIMTLGHLLKHYQLTRKLDKIVKIYEPKNDDQTLELIQTAIDLTRHKNLAIASALSILPFVKIYARYAQIIFEAQSHGQYVHYC